VIASAWRWLFRQPYLLLTLTALMWSGNAVASRLAVGEISPMALTCLRWLVVCSVLLVFARRQVVADWPLLAPRWRSILWMGALGFTVFNALFYAAGHRTSGVNISIIQGSIPIAVLVGAYLAYRTPVGLAQGIGVLLTFVGVGAVALRGDLATLTTLSFNDGDVWMLIACAFYAAYTLGLRNRPKTSGFAFFAMLAAVAMLTSLPLLGYEILAGTVQWPTGLGLAILLYVALGPSLVAQLFFMRGVDLIGPGRAGLFANLVPVFGPALSVLVLGEAFEAYHAWGVVLVLAGIWLAERRRVLPAAARAGPEP
jgi:drug/metabolite transporter (DMT)-like permease